jgi:hypothetical protein
MPDLAMVAFQPVRSPHAIADVNLQSAHLRTFGRLLPHRRPFLVTAVFTGLRSSELRGLRWSDVDLDKGEVSVRQRADRYNTIGRPKSWSGNRTIQIRPFVANTLKEWKLACPKGPLDLVFPTGNGNIESRGNLLKNLLCPAQVAAGVTVPTLGKDGKPPVKAKYPSLHALRHFYASWCINRKVDGGLELPAKVVQERLGHANIAMTLDTMGTCFRAVTMAGSWRRRSCGSSVDATRLRHGTGVNDNYQINTTRYQICCLSLPDALPPGGELAACETRALPEKEGGPRVLNSLCREIARNQRLLPGLGRMDVLAEDPFGDEQPVLMAHHHFGAASGQAVPFRIGNRAADRQGLAWIGLRKSPSAPDDLPPGFRTDDHVSQVEHGCSGHGLFG